MKTFYVVGMLHPWDSLNANTPWGAFDVGSFEGTLGFLPVFDTRAKAEEHNRLGAQIFEITERNPPDRSVKA